MAVKIGSFNMFKFSQFRSDKDIHKDLNKIADIIRGEEFDIVALQEVFSEGAINELAKILGSYWHCAWKAPNARSAQAAEGYGFLWNSRKFRPATGLKKEERSIAKEERNGYAQKVFDPTIQNRWHGQLIRDPFYARFESVHGWYEIRLINAHIVYASNSKKTDDDEECSISAAQARQRELEMLLDTYRKIEDKVYRSTRPAYTVLLGDYNLNLKSSGAKGPYLDPISEKQERNGRIQKKIITVQDELTTLKGKSHTEPDKPIHGFANNYDHFSYDKNRFHGIGMDYGRINTVEKYCDNDFEQHRKEISDHVPIYLSITLN